MALEIGTFIDDLVNTNPPGTDGKKEGDDHLRLIKSVLQGTFPDAPRAFHFPNAPAAKTGNYTVVLTDQNALITVDASGAARTITLPTFVSVFAGFSVTIQKSDTSVNTVTVDGNGAETINGDVTKVLRRVYESITVTSDGSDWKVSSRGFDETELIEGAAVASAASPNIWEGEGDTHHITGTVTITGFAAAPQAGAMRRLIFDAAVLLTDSATLNLPGDADYTTSLDDIVFVFAETTAIFKLLIFKKDGTAVVATGGDLATGDRIFFQQTTPSANFTKETSATYDDAGIRLQTGTVVTGGTDAWSVTHNSSKVTDGRSLSTAQLASHPHTQQARGSGGSEGTVGMGHRITLANDGNAGATASAGSGTSHDHPMQTDLKFAEATIGIRD